MKKTKIISTIGAIALMLGVGMNLGYSLNDYGINTHSLSAFVWAQNSTAGGGNSTAMPGYKTKRVTVTCEIIKTIGGSSESSSGVSGNVTVGIGNTTVGGGASTGNNSSSSSTITIKETYMAEKVLCEPGGASIEVCYPFDPCMIQ